MNIKFSDYLFIVESSKANIGQLAPTLSKDKYSDKLKVPLLKCISWPQCSAPALGSYLEKGGHMCSLTHSAHSQVNGTIDVF